MKPTRLGLNKGLVVSAAWGHRFKRAPRRSPRVAEGWKNLRAFIRRLPWYRFAAGVVAGGVGLLVTFLMRAFGLGVFLPEIAVNFVVGRIPGAIESFFIRTLGEGAKLLALLTALAVFLVLPGIYAILYRRVQRWLKNRWLVMAFYTFSSAGIVLLAILPILDAGFLGSNTSLGIGFAVFSQLIGYWLYAALLDYLLVDVAAEHPEGFSLSRRQFIAGTIGAIAVAALTVYGLGSLISKKGRLVFASIGEMFAKEQTPTSEFYVVTKNVFDPPVDVGTWLLSIGGWVTKIEAVQGEFRGYWQQKGWTNSDDAHGRVNTVAIIAVPADNAVVGGNVEIGGVAFAGDRGISRVEVSTDGGSTWIDATLYPRPGRGLTWVLWTFNWPPPHGGSFRIVARAYDAAGVIQDSTPAPPFPNGSSGYDSITLLVSQ